MNSNTQLEEYDLKQIEQIVPAKHELLSNPDIPAPIVRNIVSTINSGIEMYLHNSWLLTGWTSYKQSLFAALTFRLSLYGGNSGPTIQASSSGQGVMAGTSSMNESIYFNHLYHIYLRSRGFDVRYSNLITHNKVSSGNPGFSIDLNKFPEENRKRLIERKESFPGIYCSFILGKDNIITLLLFASGGFILMDTEETDEVEMLEKFKKLKPILSMFTANNAKTNEILKKRVANLRQLLKTNFSNLQSMYMRDSKGTIEKLKKAIFQCLYGNQASYGIEKMAIKQHEDVLKQKITNFNPVETITSAILNMSTEDKNNDDNIIDMTGESGTSNQKQTKRRKGKSKKTPPKKRQRNVKSISVDISFPLIDEVINKKKDNAVNNAKYQHDNSTSLLKLNPKQTLHKRAESVLINILQPCEDELTSISSNLKWHKMKKLDISDNLLTNDEKYTIVEHISSPVFKCIASLSFSKCDLSDKYLSILLNVVFLSMKNLMKLDLSHNLLSIESMKTIKRCFTSKKEYKTTRCKRFHNLILSYNPVNNIECMKVFHKLIQSKNVFEKYNYFCSIDISNIYPMIPHNKNKHIIELQKQIENTITNNKAIKHFKSDFYNKKK